MPLASLKYSRPAGDTSIDMIPEPFVKTSFCPRTAVRAAFSVTLRIWPALNAPKNRRPRLRAPRPHRRQNATPVGAMVGVYQIFGRMGFGPSWLVFRGDESLHVSCGPQP